MDNQNKNDGSKPVDLASLYPVPKTFDEIQQHHEAVERRRIERQPKHLPFWVAVNLSLSVLVFVVAINNGAVIARLGVGAGPATILLGLGWFGFTWLQVRRLSDFFASKGSSEVPFFLTYFVSVSSLATASFSLLNLILPVVVTYMLLILINMALMYILAAIVTAKNLSNVQKITMLVIVVAFSIAVAIVNVLIQ